MNKTYPSLSDPPNPPDAVRAAHSSRIEHTPALEEHSADDTRPPQSTMRAPQPPKPTTHASEPSTNLFRPGANCCAVGHAQRVAMLIDGAAYYEAFVRAARKARRSIMIVGWDFDSRTALSHDAEGRPVLRLGQFLNDLARSRRGLHIRLLEWDYPVIFGADRELSPIYGLSWKPHRRVHFRFDDTHPLAGSHHQKIVVIDDQIAFVGGLDLTSRRWDTSAHRADEPGRMFEGEPYPPMHDMMAAVDGQAARALGDIVRARWLAATRERLEPIETRHDPWPSALHPDMTDVHFGIACTSPPIEDQAPVHHVEQLYLDMIARSRQYIYIENQYFTSHKIARALADRLREPDGPEIVLVTRLLSHGWLEEFTMQVLRARHVGDLHKADEHGRFYACYPHVSGLRKNTCVDTHSKLMIVDDEWLRIGSANLSNRSMGVDTECDLVLQADGQPRVASRIRDFRDRLLAEHLGAQPEEVAQTMGKQGSMRSAIDLLGKAGRRLAPLEIEAPSETVLSAAALADLEKPVSIDRLISHLTDETLETQPGFPWGKLLGAIAVIAALTLLWRFTPLADLFTAQNMIAWTDSFSRYWWAPLVVVAAYTPASVVMFPRPLITLAAVVAFGPWEGFLYAMTGVLIASTAGFYVGRAVGRQTVRRLAGQRLNRLSQALRRRGVIAMTAVRLVPIAPFIVESMVAGAIRIKLWQLNVGTFLGMLPGTLTATIIGDTAQAALRDPSKINWWFAGSAVGLLLLGSVLVTRWLNRVSEEPIGDEAHPR